MMLAAQIALGVLAFAGVWLSIGLIIGWGWMDRAAVAEREYVMAVILGWPAHLPRLVRALIRAVGRAGQRIASSMWGRG